MMKLRRGLGALPCSSLGPDWAPGIVACPPSQTQTSVLSDGTKCFRCSVPQSANLPNSSFTSAGCPSGWTSSVSTPIQSACPGQGMQVQQLPDETYCYQCNGQSQTQLNQYLQNQQQIAMLQQQQMQQQVDNYNQQVLSQQQAYLNQLQQGGGQPGASPDQTAAAATAAGVSPGANVQDAAAYPAGLTPPPAVSWTGLGEVVLVLGAAAFILNRFGGKKGGGGGRGRAPSTHHIEKKESFDVET